jgi:hypothetical protein
MKQYLCNRKAVVPEHSSEEIETRSEPRRETDETPRWLRVWEVFKFACSDRSCGTVDYPYA